MAPMERDDSRFQLLAPWRRASVVERLH
jgi:hypothetical protein